jgi:hypothetical protein
MMIKSKTRLLAVSSMVLILICAILLISVERILPSFPEILFGQVVLARETKPLSGRFYQSAEFVLNQVALSEIEQGFYISLQDDVLFWDPWYVGFPRTELNEGEIRVLQKLLSNGRLFSQAADGTSFNCVSQSPAQEPRLESCPDGEQYMEKFVDFQWEAAQNHAVGVLQFHLTGGRLAEIRIFPAKHGIAYTPMEIVGEWWLNGLADSSPLVEELAIRATLQPISVLWPELPAEQASERAARIIGERYWRALQVIQDSSEIRDKFGTIQEIRPAIGKNSSSSWMDSNSIFFTFRVIGTHGEGAVIIDGNDCFRLQMVIQGIPLQGENYDVCP